MLLEFVVRLLIGLASILPLLLLAGCDSAKQPSGQAQVENEAPVSVLPKEDREFVGADGTKARLTYASAGKRATDAPFTGADGRDVALSDYAGRPLLVNIWATWCAPCKVELPALDRLALAQEGRVTIIAVSQDLEGRGPVREFFTAAKITNLEPFTDKQNQLAALLGGDGALPVTILYDADGKEVWRLVGGVDWDDKQIQALLAQAA